MTAPAIIQNLVNRFRDSRELYRSGRYNEAQLRQEFLNPLFEALGWDMFNHSNFAPQYREVIHEDSLEDEGSLKAPDYAFRIGTTRKFFVEAKKPKVDIRYAIHPAYQLRRYAWNAHLPLSILTDFEELAVYDCRTRPDPKDSAATGRVMLFTFEEYIDRWDEIAQIFSRDAVWNGSFDRYAEGSKGKRGTTEVDAEFLKEIEEWRILLARNIALRNFRPSAGSVVANEASSVIASEAKQSQSASEASSVNASEARQSLTVNPTEAKQPPNLHRAERQLNYAVQTTINRILFLRICEDRKIEPTDQLLQIAEGSDIYAKLLLLFQKADQKYNSGLFHFSKEKGQTSEPDTFTPSLQIDDKILRQIIKSTYFPCPYMFNEIPVEILGQVYEQFLGSVIRLTPGGQAKVEEKPEVRKAGGVYYTPRYIVDYIVQNTLGRLLGNSSGEAASALPEGRVREAGVRETSINEDGLETLRSNPMRGLPTNASGVGVLRNTGTISGLTPTQALDLRVVDPACGSGSFLLGAYQYLLDWHLNYYLSHDPQSHTRGKNPPLVATEGGEYRLTTETKKRILTASIYGVDIDSQAVEVTKLSLLLKLLEGEKGQLRLDFERVLPDLNQNIRCGNSLIDWDYFKGQMFPDEEEIQRVNPFDWQRAFPHVFAAGGFDAVIGNPPYGAILQEKDFAYMSFEFTTFKGLKDVYISFIELGSKILRNGGLFSYIVPSSWIGGPAYQVLRNFLLNYQINNIVLLPFDVFYDAYIDTLIFVASTQIPHPNHKVFTYEYPKKFKISTIDIDKYSEVEQATWGLTDGQKFILSTDLVNLLIKFSGNDFVKLSDVCSMKRGVLFDKKMLSDTKKGDDYHPYFQGDVFRYVINDDHHLWVEFSDKMKEKPKEIYWFLGSRLLLRRLVNRQQRLMASITDISYITNKNLYIVRSETVDLFFLLGLINSKLFSFLYLKQVTQATKDDFPQITIKDFLSLPFPRNVAENKVNNLSALVRQMVELNKVSAKTPFELERLKLAIENTDRAIDYLVYELYGMTKEEISIVDVS